MQVTELPIAGAFRLEPDVYIDERGYFKEMYAKERFSGIGITEPFVQDSISFSKQGVLRGLHGDPEVAKLVQVLHGEAWDVIADLRPQSPSYLRWHGEYLHADDHRQIYIPRGCVHGFLVTGEEALMFYKHSATYDPTREFGIAWNDPALAIRWPLQGKQPILSSKDLANPPLRDRNVVIPPQP